MHVHRSGAGRPLLLVHGLGSTSAVGEPMLARLAAEREVLAIDLLGHGAARPEADSDRFAGLARSLDEFLEAEGLAGSTWREARWAGNLCWKWRGRAGAVVALDPGGFWSGWERAALKSALTASLWTVRGVRPALPMLSHNVASRSLMLALMLVRPWSLDGKLVATELDAFARAPIWKR